MTEHHIPLCAEIDRLRARVKELEAENKKYHEWVSAINKYEAWKNGALARAALEFLEGKAAEYDHR